MSWVFFGFYMTSREMPCIPFSAFWHIQRAFLPPHSQACWFGALVPFGSFYSSETSFYVSSPFSFYFAKEKDVICSFLVIVSYSKCQFLHSSVSYISPPLRRYGLLQTLWSFSSLTASLSSWPCQTEAKFWSNSFLKIGRISSRPFLLFFLKIGQLFCE